MGSTFNSIHTRLSGFKNDNKTMYFNQYISSEGSKNLKKYQYHGSDNSLIYKKILTPLNNYLIEWLPLWMAPNLITLLGLLCVSISHIIFVYYSPSLEGEAPTWTYLFAAITLFTYQTLDNLDGKQARRTNSSSPLGLLFDHGCDAINVTIGCCTLASVCQLGPTWKSMIVFIFGNFTFICATWEEYYTGALKLPIINGPTEGILTAIFIKLMTAMVGPKIWTQEYISGVYNNTWLVIFILVLGIFTIIHNFRNVFKAVRFHNDSIFVAVTRLFPFIILNALAILWMLGSPTNVMVKHPRLMLWTLGFLNSKLVLHLMLAHLCGEEYHPFRKTLVPIFYLAIHSWFCTIQGMYPQINEVVALNEFFFISLISYIHIVVTVICEVKTVLNIPVFSILKKDKRL